MIPWIEEANRSYLESGRHRETSKIPRRRLAVVACMDARLTRMLADAMGIEDGDAAVIRNAGGTVTDPHGETMHAILVTIYELDVTDIVVIGHTDCGAREVTSEGMRELMLARGIDAEAIEAERIEDWVGGLDTPEGEVMRAVRMIAGHTLVPEGVRVHGMVLDTATGRLTDVGAS